MNRVPVSTAERQDRRFAIIASAPAVITIGALFVYPMLYAVVLSFYRVNDKTPASNGIVGVGNYLSLLSDSSPRCSEPPSSACSRYSGEWDWRSGSRAC